MRIRQFILMFGMMAIALLSSNIAAANPYQQGLNKHQVSKYQQQLKQGKVKQPAKRVTKNNLVVKRNAVNQFNRQVVQTTKPARSQSSRHSKQYIQNQILRKQARAKPAYPAKWSKQEKFNLAKLNTVRPQRPSYMDSNRDNENGHHRHDRDRHDRDRHGHNHHDRHNRHGHNHHGHRHRPHRHGWYNTHLVAPIHVHYHRVGHRLRVLPRSYINIVVGGLPFYYASGVYYRPFNSGYIAVTAPIGAFIRELPAAAIGFTLGMLTYYFVNDTYYRWNEPQRAYEVVEKPEGADTAMDRQTRERLVIYPNEGQNEEQQARDRYECHRWAVSESGIDPTEEDVTHQADETGVYRRAIKACLGGRDYTVT